MEATTAFGGLDVAEEVFVAHKDLRFTTGHSALVVAVAAGLQIELLLTQRGGVAQPAHLKAAVAAVPGLSQGIGKLASEA